MNEKSTSFQIDLSPRILEEVERYVTYQNIRRKLEGSEEEIQVEDIVKAALIHYLGQLEQAIELNKFKKIASDVQFPLKNNIAEIMLKNGMKQAELSRKTGIKSGNMSMIVNNKVQPSMENFLKIWSVLKFPPLHEIFYRDYLK
ncbi:MULTISPECIES: helix-turn-helix transcriptional regulator [Bacillus cereus group]|uniref:helix-turn-helix transcriptional regulator n=1 Tax=Bacillus cereus group TaxID=86661 RepID=UPI001D1350FD|nr:MULTISPECIES: helix-turn-helix transcriptional regulator [Bacillus cereus group]MCC2357722.1 helix-turn-helix transcriptional regulator [Bacillus paranthracis]MCC3686864.1 helix-turn-helix transcriptional regulator [Bacillus cereus]